MRVSQVVRCEDLPCADVRHDCYQVPDIEICPEDVSIILISEAAPTDPEDYYYARGDPLFQQATILAFRDAGAGVSEPGHNKPATLGSRLQEGRQSGGAVLAWWPHLAGGQVKSLLHLLPRHYPQ